MMGAIVTLDRLGRIVIPKDVRSRLKLIPGTKFLLATRGAGRMILQTMDPDELALRLEEELRGVDVEAISRRIRKKVDEEVRRRYPEVFG